MDSREIIQVFDFSGDDECKVMFYLVEKVDGDSLRLNAGFSCRELVRKITELKILLYVYPIKSNKINGSEALGETYPRVFTDVILWLREYYVRCHTEVSIPVLKGYLE